MPSFGLRYIIPYCFSLLAAGGLSLSLTAQVTFQKVYGGSGLDKATTVLQHTDGGYIVGGYTASFGMGSSDAILIKMDAYGDTLWTRTYGRNREDACNDLMPLQDGWIFTGSYTVANGSNTDVYLVRTDNDGDIKVNKAYGDGGAYSDVAARAKPTSDGGYIIAGTTLSYGQGISFTRDIYIVKTDSAGMLQWARTFGTSDDDGGADVCQAMDGGFIILGQMNNGFSGDSDISLLKLDKNGNLKWIRTYGGSEGDGASSLLQTEDNGFIVCGSSTSFTGWDDILLMKTDSLGNLEWAQVYGGNQIDAGIGVCNTYDGGYAITGYTYSFGAGNADVYLLKMDSLGGLEWSKTFGGTNNDAGYSVQQTQDSGYVIAGYTKSFGAGDDDIYLIKTDKYGTSGCNETDKDAIITNVMDVTSSVIVGSKGTLGSGGTGANVITSTTSPAIANSVLCLDVGVGDMPDRKNGLSLEIYPNPHSGRFTAAFTLVADAEVTITILDICGRVVLRKAYYMPAGAGRLEADLSGQADGIYVVKLTAGSSYAVKRAVLRR